MSRKRIQTSLLSLALLLSIPVGAASSALCPVTGVSIGFFNGVGNKQSDANKNLETLMEIHGQQYAPSGEPIRYQLYYNHTAGLEADLIEVFSQRLAERGESPSDYFDLFWDVFSGHRNAQLISSLLTQGDDATAKFIDDLYELPKARIAEEFKHQRALSPTMTDYTEHRANIESLLAARQKLVFVGHSQGNLFMNQAYQYAAEKVGTGAVKAIHIAPASQKLFGEYTLSRLDLVIQGLRITPGVVPDSNTTVTPSLTDMMGHGLVETYLREGTEARSMILGHLGAALSSVQRPPATAGTGALTVTLAWDGFGNVDLHVKEPTGAHVYDNVRDGNIGKLVVANRMANGPEQYAISCDAPSVVAGDYDIGINNVSGAEGRKAVVQVSSGTGDILLKRLVDVGPVHGRQGDNAPVHVMSFRPTIASNGTLTVAER